MQKVKALVKERWLREVSKVKEGGTEVNAITIEITNANDYTLEQIEEMIIDHLSNWDVEVKVIVKYKEK